MREAQLRDHPDRLVLATPILRLAARAAARPGSPVIGTFAPVLAKPFTPSHRGGSGPPLVCLHGFVDTWRAWDLVLPALERRHDVLALTLPGPPGGPPIDGPISRDTLADGVERALDDAGFELAHLVGNSLGGYVALQLAARGRARTVVALAPAGGWAAHDASYRDLLAFQRELVAMATDAAPHADAIMSTPDGRRRATRFLTVNHEHIPPELLAHNLRGAAAAPAAFAMIEHALEVGFALDAEKIACRSASSGAPRIGCCRGLAPPSAIATTGCRTPTGSSSKASATVRSSTSRSRPHS